MNSIQNKLILIFIIGLFFTTGLTGFIVVKYESWLTSNLKLSDKTHDLKSAALKSQVYFKTQIQEWKNILLRGSDKKLYEKYYNSFILYEEKTMQEVESLSVLAQVYPALNVNVLGFIEEHKKLSALYREGLLIYKKTKHNPQIATDKYVRGIDREPIKLLARVVNGSEKIYRDKYKVIQQNLESVKRTVAVAYVLTFVLLILFFWFAIKKGVSQPFREEIRKKHHIAMTDGLTGIANRHAYKDRISSEIERYRNNGAVFTLLVFDIDKFKSINDRFGHESGDNVIVETAKLLKNHIRKNDFVSRYGGEEFVVVLPESNMQASARIAEKLRVQVETHRFVIKNEKVDITVSVGLAEIKNNETGKDIFERADAALYEAKKSGRNKCVKS